MEERKKKTIMIAIIVGCVGLAVGITFMRGSDRSGITSIDPGNKVWVKCNNPSCGAEYQIPTKEYFETIEKTCKSLTQNPPLVCQKCKQESVFLAQECKVCGKVFISGTAKPGDVPDRCPHCGQSYIETEGKKAAGAGGTTQ